MSKFVLLLHDAGRFPNLSPDQMQAVIQRYIAWRARIQKDGRAVSGHKLHDGEGRVMRGSGGSMKVTDGPCPHLDFGAIEIREVQPTA